MKDSNLLRDNLQKAFGLFLEAMRLYIPSVMQKAYGKLWDEEYFEALSDSQKEIWNRNTQMEEKPPQMMIDFGNLKGFALNQKRILRGDFGREANNLPTMFDQIATARNMVAHFDAFDPIKADDAFLQMIKIGSLLKMNELVEELTSLRESEPEREELQESTIVKAAEPDHTAWFNNVKPHLDIRQGNLDESVFAADLAEVVLGTGREVYQNDALFFSKTYFTAGLKNVATRVIKGLNGREDAQNRVISLQTGFGGGKTHTLISLYHLARGGNRITGLPAVQDLIESGLKPEFEQASIAVFTNTTNDPVQGRKVDSIHIRTLWGELAYQLGGKEAYKIIEANDQDRVSPAGLFKIILDQCKPALILIDELADYCVKASGVTVGSSNLSDQTISFMQEFSEAISRTDHVVGVVTLPASEREVADSPQAASILARLKDRVGRIGADTLPVAEDEIFEVIRYRLFENLGSLEVRKGVIAAYQQEYLGCKNELPSQATKTTYKELMERSYPFHPELIDIFRKRWAGNPQFQRTRGVLRILASIVSDLWKRKNTLPGTQTLIHTSHVRLENLDSITGEIKKLYGHGYDAVITQDVAGVSSNAYIIDDEKPGYGDYQLAQGVSTTIFLSSFGSDGANRGITIQDLKLAVLVPDAFNHNSVNGVLDELESRAYYLYYAQAGAGTKRYWYHTKPNLNILINKVQSEISNKAIESEIVNRLNAYQNSINKFKVSVAPHADLPEQKIPVLVILHPSHYVNGNAKSEDVIKTLATRKGNSERLYRNTMLFLSISQIGRSQLYADVKEFLACEKTKEDYRTQLGEDQKLDLRERTEEAKSKLIKGLVTSYHRVHKYVATEGIQTLEINQFRDPFNAQVDTNIYETLKTEEWILEAVGANTLRRHNLFPEDGMPIQTKIIYEAFLRFDDKQMITGKQAIEISIQRYILSGQFAVGAGDKEDYQNAWYREQIPGIDVEDETYWLLSVNDYNAWKSSQQTPVGYPPTPEPDTLGDPDGEDKIPPPVQPDQSVIRTLTISGSVDTANYHQVFSSFIRPLIDNKVKIELRITAQSTNASPITKSSPQYKITKESAQQLGLDFEVEE